MRQATPISIEQSHNLPLTKSTLTSLNVYRLILNKNSQPLQKVTAHCSFLVKKIRFKQGLKLSLSAISQGRS